MKKSKMWFGMFGVLFVVFAIGGLIAFVYYYSTPHNQTIKIWTPANYHIDNPAEENGQYAAIDEVRVDGTAMYLSFVEYQQYQNRKNATDNAVMIQEDGTVFYQTKESDKNYVTKKRYGMAPFLDPKVTKITGDTIDFSQEVPKDVDIVLLGLVLDFFASAFVSGIIVVIIMIVGYFRKITQRKTAAS